MKNKQDLAQKVQELYKKQGENVKKDDALLMIDNVFEALEFLTLEDTVNIHGHGKYEIRERAARKGRNPQTGEDIEIEAKRTPFFKAGKVYKERVR